jgi:hypothetical protein
MRYVPTRLYQHAFPDLSEQLQASIEHGCQSADNSKTIDLFFRADDIGVPSGIFAELIALFQRHQLPLCLAVVPSWLSKQRYIGLRSITGLDDTLWCWHQHGRLHKNFEPEGKKQEFGPARDFSTLKQHLLLGKNRLETLLEESFQPFFTPPWNRCSRDTALALKELKFHGISRSRDARPDLTDILPDIQVNVDLHTRKEPDPAASLKNLLIELEMSLSSGRCGIMIHHQRMNSHAFVLLDLLMRHLVQRPEISPRLFLDMV